MAHLRNSGMPTDGSAVAGGLPAGAFGLGPLTRARRRRSTDVVVIGGGLSGLVAARELTRAGASVIVLEARDRVGGRLESGRLAGVSVDLGGCWIGAGHDRMRALIAELGISTFPTHHGGERVVARTRRIGRGPLGRRLAARSFARIVDRIDRLAATISPDSPWESAGARSLDACTVDSWLRSTTLLPSGREVVRDTLINVLAADPSEVSLMHALWYLRSGGGLATLIATAGGAQQDLVAGGAHAVAERLADGLGEAVQLGSPVRIVERTDSRVRAAGTEFEVEADRAVVALSPALAARIAFSPARPQVRAPALVSGDVIKYVAVYDEAFWRHDGLSGMAWGDALPFSFSHDVSAPGGSPGILAVFALADRVRRLRRLAPPDRETAITHALGECFGDGVVGRTERSRLGGEQVHRA